MNDISREDLLAQVDALKDDVARWKLQAEDWQKRGWELGSKLDDATMALAVVSNAGERLPEMLGRLVKTAGKVAAVTSDSVDITELGSLAEAFANLEIANWQPAAGDLSDDIMDRAVAAFFGKEVVPVAGDPEKLRRRMRAAFLSVGLKREFLRDVERFDIVSGETVPSPVGKYVNYDAAAGMHADLQRITALSEWAVPLHKDCKYIFMDGYGDIEIDLGGEMRTRIEQLEAIITGAAPLPFEVGSSIPSAAVGQDRFTAITAAARRFLRWCEPVAGDNRDDGEGAEEIASVEMLKELLAKNDPEYIWELRQACARVVKWAGPLAGDHVELEKSYEETESLDALSEVIVLVDGVLVPEAWVDHANRYAEGWIYARHCKAEGMDYDPAFHASQFIDPHEVRAYGMGYEDFWSSPK